MARKQKNKSESQLEHANSRAQARFGITLGKQGQDALKDQIMRGKARCLYRQSLRVAAFELVYEGHTMAAVYDKNTKNIVTVMPISWMCHSCNHSSQNHFLTGCEFCGCQNFVERKLNQ